MANETDNQSANTAVDEKKSYVTKLLKDIGKTWESLEGSIFYLSAAMPVAVRIKRGMDSVDTHLPPSTSTRVRVASVDSENCEAIITIQQPQIVVAEITVEIRHLIACTR